MKFEEEVLHLRRMGLAVLMPDGRLHQASRSLRNPRGVIPVRVLKKGSLPRDLREMIRQSRAEARNAHPARRK